MSSSIQLPTERRSPTRRDPHLLIIYGPPKVGKTTVLTQLSNNLILDGEHGADFLEALSMEVTGYRHLMTTIEAIQTAGCPYSYVSLDTLDNLEEWCDEECSTEYRKSSSMKKNPIRQSVTELAYGAGYYMIWCKWKEALRKLKACASTVILVGHVRDKITDKEGGNVFSQDLSIQGKLKIITTSMADAIGYMYRRKEGGEEKLMVTFKTNEKVTCGGRCEHLQGQKFEFDWSKILVDKQP